MLLKQIQYFIAVAEYRHFTRAANHLFVSQSALSQQITKLENDLGLKLINREKLPIELTDAGKELLLHAGKVLNEIEEMQKQLQKYLPIEKRTIHLGMITGLGNINIANILSSFNTKYPDINFTITTKLTKELCHLLKEGSIDLGIFAAPYNIKEYNFEVLPLEQEEFVLIVPANHHLAQKECIELAETREEKHIFPTAENVSHDIFLAECKKSGFTPKIASECTGPGRRIDLVKGGMGIALISLSGLHYYNCQGLAILRLQDPFHKQIVVARAKSKQTPPILLSLWNYINQLPK